MPAVLPTTPVCASVTMSCEQQDARLPIHQELKKKNTIIITVKIQLRLSWEHLRSLWKLKFYGNQMPVWPCARSQGGCAILHSNEPPPKKTLQLCQTGPKYNIVQKSEAHAADFGSDFHIFTQCTPTNAIQVINKPPCIITNLCSFCF